MIINRYIAKSYYKYVFLILIIVISLFVIIEYLTRAGLIVKEGMSLLEGFGFVLLKAPYIFSLVLPVACILAPIAAIGLMRRNNELIALKSGGISAYTILKPIVMCGVILGVCSYAVSDFVVPTTISKAYEIQRQLKNKNVKTTKDNNIWLKEDQRILFIEYYNVLNKSLSNISIFEFNNSFDLTRRIDAKLAVFKDDLWMLEHVLELRLNTVTHGYDSFVYDEKHEELGLMPGDLKRVIKNSEEMTLKELYEYVKKVESEGYDAGYYKADMFGKTAWPFTCLLMALMGSGIVLARQKKDALATNFALGTVVAFLFWFFNSFCISLGYAGLIPSLLSAWLANFLLMCVCCIVLLNAE